MLEPRTNTNSSAHLIIFLFLTLSHAEKDKKEQSEDPQIVWLWHSLPFIREPRAPFLHYPVTLSNERMPSLKTVNRPGSDQRMKKPPNESTLGKRFTPI